MPSCQASAEGRHHLIVARLPLIDGFEQRNQLILDSEEQIDRNITVLNAASLKPL